MIAALMLVVLLGSLAAARGLTAGRANRAAVSTDVQTRGLALSLPGTWQRVEPTAAQAESHVTPMRFADTTRPSRTLVLLPIRSPSPVPGEALMPAVVGGLVRLTGAAPAQTLGGGVRREGDLVVTEWLGISPPAADAPGDAGGQPTRRPTVHLAADLTRDGRLHWLVYLTDRAAAGENPRALARWNLGLLRSIVGSARAAPKSAPDAAPPATVKP